MQRVRANSFFGCKCYGCPRFSFRFSPLLSSHSVRCGCPRIPFAGVGYPFAVDAIRTGDVVLDIGSGSGTDALISAQLAGATGKVYALDMTLAMREKLKHNARIAALNNVEIIAAEAENIPLPDASVDVISSNGVLNLVPNKERALAEMFRVLKPGGRVQIADIVVHQEISEPCRSTPKLWAECIAGAIERDDFLTLFRSVGFKDVVCLQQLDYFSASASEETREVAELLGAHAIVVQASR